MVVVLIYYSCVGVIVAERHVCYCLPAQQILGAYTLQSTLQAVVTDIYGIADSVSARITAAVNLASYASIHPLYIQARGHPRCLTIQYTHTICQFSTQALCPVV